MAGKSPPPSKILNDTHDLMTLMTHAACAFHAYIPCVICSGINSCIFCRICVCFSKIILIFVGRKIHITGIWLCSIINTMTPILLSNEQQ